MNFVVLVPAHISDLEFSWQSLTKHPVSLFSNILFRLVHFTLNTINNRAKIPHETYLITYSISPNILAQIFELLLPTFHVQTCVLYTSNKL